MSASRIFFFICLSSYLFNDFFDCRMIMVWRIDVAPAFLHLKKAVICRVMVRNNLVGDILFLEYGCEQLRFDKIVNNGNFSKWFISMIHMSVHGQKKNG